MKTVMDCYAAYDSDPRVSGPDDFEAFRDAVDSYVDTRLAPYRNMKRTFDGCRVWPIPGTEDRYFNLLNICDEIDRLEER